MIIEHTKKEIHDLNEVTTNKRVKKAQSQDRFNATPTSHHVSKTSMKSIGATTVTTMTTTSTATSKHHNIISTSSWRVGEALVQKQLGDYLSDIKAPISSNRHEQHQHPRSAIAMNSASYSKETKKQTSKSAPKTVKRTECHLVDDAASTTRLRTAASKENLAESSKKSKSKPYDIEDIRRYMEQQKIKRLQVIHKGY